MRTVTNSPLSSILMRAAMLFTAMIILACSFANEPTFIDNLDCHSTVEKIKEEPLRETRVRISSSELSVIVNVEVADTEPSRSRGLMCRANVPAGSGMLFDLGTVTEMPFWMFNTYVPLDIVYFNIDGAVTNTVAMFPCTRMEDETEQNWRNRCLLESQDYVPGGYYNMALELPRGWLLSEGFTLSELPSDMTVTIL